MGVPMTLGSLGPKANLGNHWRGTWAWESTGSHPGSLVPAV